MYAIYRYNSKNTLTVLTSNVSKLTHTKIIRCFSQMEKFKRFLIIFNNDYLGDLLQWLIVEKLINQVKIIYFSKIADY